MYYNRKITDYDRKPIVIQRIRYAFRPKRKYFHGMDDGWHDHSSYWTIGGAERAIHDLRRQPPKTWADGLGPWKRLYRYRIEDRRDKKQVLSDIITNVEKMEIKEELSKISAEQREEIREKHNLLINSLSEEYGITPKAVLMILYNSAKKK